MKSFSTPINLTTSAMNYNHLGDLCQKYKFMSISTSSNPLSEKAFSDSRVTNIKPAALVFFQPPVNENQNISNNHHPFIKRAQIKQK